jgi:hypothetical protein
VNGKDHRAAEQREAKGKLVHPAMLSAALAN